MTTWGNEAPLLFVTALIFLVIARRSVQMARGVSYSTTRLWGQALLFLFLFAFTLAFDLLVLPLWTLGVDIGLFAVGGVIATRHVRRVIEFTRGNDGRWMYRLGILLPAIYLSLYVVRVGVELLVLPFALEGSGTIPTLDALQQAALAGVDALFAVSAGLLVGRSIGVYQAFEERQRNLPPLPAAPPPPPTLPF